MIVLPGLSTLPLSGGQGVCFAKRQQLRVCDREKTRSVLAFPLADLLLHPHHRCSWELWIPAVKGVWGATSTSSQRSVHAAHPHSLTASRLQIQLEAVSSRTYTHFPQDSVGWCSWLGQAWQEPNLRTAPRLCFGWLNLATAGVATPHCKAGLDISGGLVNHSPLTTANPHVF